MPAGIGKLRFAEKAACLGRPSATDGTFTPREVYGGSVYHSRNPAARLCARYRTYSEYRRDLCVVVTEIDGGMPGFDAGSPAAPGYDREVDSATC